MSVRRRIPARHRRDQAGDEVSAEDIYLMVMLHDYQRMSCRDIARRFAVSEGRVYEIIARRSNGGCCG